MTIQVYFVEQLAMWRWHGSRGGRHPRLHLFMTPATGSVCEMVPADSLGLLRPPPRETAIPCQICAAYARRTGIKVPPPLRRSRPARLIEARSVHP